MILLYLLPFLTALNGINMKMAGLNIRTDQLFVVLLIIIILSAILLGKIRFYLDKAGRLLLLFFLWSFVVSLFFSPDSKYSIIQTINLLSSASVYFVLTNLLRPIKFINKYFKCFLLAGIFATSYGILIFVLSLMGLNIYGVNLSDDFSVAYGVFATMREPNVFGSFSLLYFILSSVIIVSLPRSKRKYDNLIFFLLLTSCFSVFLSFTRGVWFAACIGIIVTLTFNKRLFKFFSQKIKFVFSMGSLLVAIFIIANLFISTSIFYYKLSHFLDFKGGTGAHRMEIWKNALDSIQKSPILGHGTYSYATLFSPTLPGPGDQKSVAWIGNFLLILLHDTGIIGTILFLWVIKVLLKEGIKTTKKLRHTDPMNAAISYGLCLSLMCMLIAFFFTTAFSFVYAWSILGLISVYVRYGKKLERQNASVKNF